MRDSIEVNMGILEAICEGIKTSSHITGKLCTNYNVLRRHIKILEERDLIIVEKTKIKYAETHTKKGFYTRIFHYPTEKGKKVLKHWKELNSMIATK